MKKILCLILASVMIFSAASVSFFSVSAAEKNIITAENPAVVIRTSFATCGFDDNWGGVHTAVPIKDKEGFILYDVIIWEDRINLYKFPNNVEQNEEQGFDFSLDVSTKAGLKKYVEWRESFCIKSVACKDTDNISKCSGTMKKAFIEFFKIVNKRSPSKNVILKYSGHGNLGFCGCMNVEDTKTTLEKGVKIFGQKFALIDFGTNCQSSNTDYLQVYHSFTEYMLASQFDYGGYSLDEWDYEIYKQVSVDYQYSNMFQMGKSVKQACKNIINTEAKRWPYCKNNLRKGKIKQSMTLFDMSKYDSFMTEFAKLLSKSGGFGEDAYTVIKKKGSKKLRNLYNKFVAYYKDNNSKEFFKWDKAAYGLTTYYGVVGKIELSETQYTYNGKSKKPKVTVSLASGGLLREGYDYTVTYQKGRKNPGKYKVTISLKNNYGSKEYRYFTVKPDDVSVKSLTAGKKSFKLKWKPDESGITGYQIQYSLKSNFSSAKSVWVKNAKASSKSVKKLKSKKKYYVRIRAYKTIDGKKIYSSWSAKKTVKTK